MTEWLRPLKILEYCVEHWFGDVAEAERQLFQAVIRGEVRARHAGKVLGPEQLRQIPKMEVDASNPFVLSPDVELSVEDAELCASSAVRTSAPRRHHLHAQLTDRLPCCRTTGLSH